MQIFIQSTFLFTLATLFGIFEIEGEGKYGWAEKFPTWYRVNGFVPKLYGMITNKPLTGYHSALFFVPLFIFFYPMVAAWEFNLAGALWALGSYFVWAALWDFTWFVLNPYYGISKFRKESVWWFAREPWLFGRVPLGYIMGWGLSLILSALSGWADGGVLDVTNDRLQMMGWFLVWTMVLVAVAPLYGYYYDHMREFDERDEANIFHKEEP